MTERSPWSVSLRFGLMVALAILSGLAEAQTPDANSSSSNKAALIDDIVIGSRVLAEFGVLDGFGHVSARDPANANQIGRAHV